MQEQPNYIRIQEYSLADFVAKIQDLVQRGYVFDFKSNESYPVQIGSMFAAGLFVKEPEAIEAVQSEAVQDAVEQAVVQTVVEQAVVQTALDQPEVKPAVRRGRK